MRCVSVNSPGESCLFFKGFNHFYDVRGIPDASALRHLSATSPSWWFVLARSNGDLPLWVCRHSATARQENGNAFHERRAGTNAYTCPILDIDVGAGADARLCPPIWRGVSLFRHLHSVTKSSELIGILIWVVDITGNSKLFEQF